MRFMKDLSQETLSLLQRIYRESKHYRVRQRAHCLMLSCHGYTAKELQKIFHVNLFTIYHWFDAWELRRFCGLYEKKGHHKACVKNAEIQLASDTQKSQRAT
jgi:transposase